MRRLIARILAGQAPSPADPIADGIAASLAARAADRRPPAGEAKRFARARPKVEQLRREIAMQMVEL